MPDAWMPDLIHDPGKGAGYALGQIDVQCVKVHCTAGNNSYSIVKDGVPAAPSTLAQFLIPYEGVPWQFTEVDALCYDSGPYNRMGPGFEIERPVTGTIRPGLSEFRDLSPDQTYWTGRIIRWLHDEWGVQLALYGGPRYPQVSLLRCFVNHGDIDSNRSDGITPEEWDACLAASGGDDLNEQQTRELIDKVVFDASDTGFGVSRVNAAIDDYVFKPHDGIPSRFAAALLTTTKDFAAEIKKRLSI